MLEKDMIIWEQTLEIAKYERILKDFENNRNCLLDINGSSSRVDEDILVSVIIPVYNVEKFLVKCVDSVRAQSHKNIEIILVNDGSKDRCPQICESFSVIDSRIRVIHKENGGLSSARNAGLDVAKGKYVYFLDSDDYIESELLKRTVRLMEETDSDWLGFWAIKEDLKGNKLCQIAFKEDNVAISSEEERMRFFMSTFFNYKVGWEACFHIYKRDIIEQNGIRFISEREVFAEDMLFSFNYMLYANSYMIIPEAYYHYVQREESLLGSKKHINILPNIHMMLEQMYESVKKSELKMIQEKFSFIYLAVMEWHTRSYINENGIEWVKNELSKINTALFLPKENFEIRDLYLEGIEQYGQISGVISVIVTFGNGDDVNQLNQYLDEILSQNIQRLEVIVLNETNAKLKYVDSRVCSKNVEKADQIAMVKVAIEDCNGEYIYFGEKNYVPHHSFLETVSSAMKYNECGAGIMDFSEKTMVYVAESQKHREWLGQYMLDKMQDYNNVILRKNALKHLHLLDKDSVSEYIKKMITLGNTIILNSLN